MTPTIKQLKYLIALDEHLHFGKAAAACFISQSAFSLAIKELETTLDVHLVDRTNKSVMITDAGSAIVRQARLCINDVDTLVDIAKHGQEPLSGRLILGVIPTIAPYILPTFMPESRILFPKLKLFLREARTSEIYEQLLEGKIDLMLVALPFDLKNVTIMPLFKDPLLLAYAEGSQWLTGEKGDLNFESLPDESVLLLEDGHCLREHALAACHIRDADQISRFAGTSLPTLLQMVVADIGVTLIPEMAKPSLVGEGSSLRFQVIPGKSTREIGLVWRKGSHRSEEFTQIGELLQGLFPH